MKISTSQYQSVVGQGEAAAADLTEAASARELLHQVAVGMVGKNGAIKSGYLKLVPSDGQSLRLGTRWSKSSDASTRAALRFVTSLAEKAYGANPTVAASLQRYLQASGEGHLGTHSFVKLVRTLEKANGYAPPSGDRLSVARVKNDARLDTTGFTESVALLAKVTEGSFREQVTDPDPSDRGEAGDPLISARPTNQDPPVPEDVLIISQQQHLVLEEGPPVQLQVPASQAPIDVPASVAQPSVVPLAAPIDLRQTALTALQYGNRTEALRALQQLEGDLSPKRLAEFLVQDHLQGRAVSTQMVLLAEAAYAKSKPVAIDDAARFFCAGFTAARQEALQEPGSNASGPLSGLLDVAMLWKARRPAEAAGLVERLVHLLPEYLPEGESAPALSQRLHAISNSQPIAPLDEHATEDLDERKALLAQQVNNQAETVGYISIRAEFEHDDDTLRPGDVRRIATAASARGLIPQGSTFEHVAVTNARSSSLEQCYNKLAYTVGPKKPVDLQRCILSGLAGSALQLKNSNFSGSTLIFGFDDYSGADLQRIYFAGATLDDAQIEIDYSAVEDRLTTLRGRNNPEVEVEGYMVRLFNHLDRHSRTGLFTVIASIDDRYAGIKVGLMRQALELLAREHCVEALAPALVDVLSKSPDLLADARIRELSAPILPSMFDTLARSDDPKILPVYARLFEVLLKSNAEPAAAQSLVRSHIKAVNAFLRRVEDNPNAFDQSVQTVSRDLRARLQELPEIKPILPTLEAVSLDFTRADGTSVPMPYYFDFGDDGAVAALYAGHYSAVAKAAPEAKLIEDTIFFVPPAQRVGQVNQSYFPVDGSELVMLAPGNIKDRGVALIRQFPQLQSAYQTLLAGAKNPSLELLEPIFGGSASSNAGQRLTEAFNGIAQTLNLEQIVELETQFSEHAPHLFTNAPEAGVNAANWPALELHPTFLQTLSDQASSLGISVDRPRDFAYFLFTHSAVLTRLSSEKVFGDGYTSITPMRMLGYALFKQALRVDPGFLPQSTVKDMEDRFLKRNNAFECAEILSRSQLKSLRQIDSNTFELLTPGVFKAAAA